MFGLGKILGDGIFGKFFDSIGMSWMNNVISLAADVATGNWLAAAGDVFNLVSQFSNNSSWQNRVAQFAPLGEFGTGGFNGGSLSESRLNDWRSMAIFEDPQANRPSTQSLNAVSGVMHDNLIASQRAQDAQRYSKV